MSEDSQKKEIPLSEPEISGNEWKYIKECLDTGWVSYLGSYVNQFEHMLAEYIGTRYAVAMVNGTAALHISLLLCGVQENDEVIVPALTFIAPVNAVRYCNSHPIFMDSYQETLCIDTEKVNEFLIENCEMDGDGFCYNKRTKRRVKAMIPVHVFGHPSDMKELLEISNKYNIDIIEDATESLGSEYAQKKTGSFGRIGCFSFNGNKIITAGGGGMLVTDDESLAKKAKHLSTQAKRDPFEYDHDEIGYNYRLTNIQAAIGVAQMERLDEFIAIKRGNALLYKTLLSDLDNVDFLWEKEPSKSNFWFYTIRVSPEHKKPLMNYLLSKNVQVRPVWKLIHTLSMYEQCETYKIDNAVKAYETCINLPCSVSISRDDIEFVTDNIKRYFR